MGDDYDPRLPTPAPLPLIDQTVNHPVEDPAAQGTSEQDQNQSISTESAAAPQRRALPARLARIDQRTELQNKDLGEWNTNYLDNMAQLKQAKQSRAIAQAKHNAAFWVLGQGIGGVETNFGQDPEPHPLAVFSGQNLLAALLGPDGSRSPTSSKRARSSSTSSEERRRVRARTADYENVAREPADDGQTMGFGDEEGIMVQGEDFNPESEVGRRAGSSIPDIASVLPWNRSGSHQGSAQPLISAVYGISSSVGGPGSGMKFGPGNVMAGLRSRMASSSPLGGKGRQPMDLDDLKNLAGQNPADEDALTLDDDAFEQYGPAAAVDTQTAAQSQWMRSTLESEAQNFLGFVETQLIARGEDGQLAESVTLDQLLPPTENSGVVAAQALLHVLALTTKGLLEVEQEDAFGDIVLKIVHAQSHEHAESDNGEGGQAPQPAPEMPEGDVEDDDEDDEL